MQNIGDWTRPPESAACDQPQPAPTTIPPVKLPNALPGRPIRHPSLPRYPWVQPSSRVTRKVPNTVMETRAVETSLPTTPHSRPSPARMVGGHRHGPAVLSQPSRSRCSQDTSDETCPNLQDIRSVRAVNFVQFCKQSDVKVMRIHMAELKELEDEEETRKQFDELPVGLIEVPDLADESFRRLVEGDCTLAEAKRVFPPYFHTFLESYLGEDEAGERLRRKADEADVEKFLRVKPTLAMKDVLALLPKEFHHHAKHFLPKSAEELPPHRPWDHKIELLPGKEVPYYKNRPFSPDELRCVKKWIDEMLDKGFIRESTSPAAAPLLLAAKPGGGVRICHDYRGLNAVTVKNRYPLPLIRETRH